MKRTLALIVFVVTVTANAQNMGIGVRLGDPTGISFKKYTGSNAWEINFGRSWYFYNHNWYDHNFDYWYNKQHYNYTSYQYIAYRRYIPACLQIRYLWQKPLKELEGLNWYFGLGGQFRFQRFDYSYRYKVPGDNTWYYSDYQRVTDFDFGVDFVLGLEYKFSDAPVSLFLDANLFLELFDHPFYPWGQGGIGARFNF